MKKGFDNDKYVKIQSKKIKERFKLFDKLYLEVGGKLFDDSHAARILPGFKNDVKISMFKQMKNDLEIIFCINAGDIEKHLFNLNKETFNKDQIDKYNALLNTAPGTDEMKKLQFEKSKYIVEQTQ